jgi:hypothetical protein
MPGMRNLTSSPHVNCYVGLIKEAKRKDAILFILWIYLVNEKRELASG